MEQTTTDATNRRDGRRHRMRGIGRVLAIAAAGVIAATLIAGAVVWRGQQAAAENDSSHRSTSLAELSRQTLSSRITVDGVLGYADDYRVVNHAPGIVTSLPSVGDVVHPGEALYMVAGSPVVLLPGDIPAWRGLSEGMQGPDVAQLNAALVALGYGDPATLDPHSDTFSTETAAALARLQAALGIEESGVLDLGQAVFLPGPARITAVDATLGGMAQPGATVLKASSTVPVVTVALNPSLQSQINAGDVVTVTLPDRRMAEGVVVSIGSVATAPASGGTSGSGQSRPVIDVIIELSDAGAAGTLDQAPVSVSITTSVVEDILVAPVTALVALAGGGHALEVERADGTRELVPVTTGLFDSSRGLVEVRGDGLAAGQQVVVPGTTR